jgi:hypothetical protein
MLSKAQGLIYCPALERRAVLLGHEKAYLQRGLIYITLLITYICASYIFLPYKHIAAISPALYGECYMPYRDGMRLLAIKIAVFYNLSHL